MRTAFFCLAATYEGQSGGAEGRTFRLLDARLGGEGWAGRRGREGESGLV